MNLNTVSFVQEAGDRGSFACLHVLNACLHVQRRHPRDGIRETAWVQANLSFCQQLNQVKFWATEMQQNLVQFSKSRKIGYIYSTS